jgi:hypothetical protein
MGLYFKKSEFLRGCDLRGKDNTQAIAWSLLGFEDEAV